MSTQMVNSTININSLSSGGGAGDFTGVYSNEVARLGMSQDSEDSALIQGLIRE